MTEMAMINWTAMFGTSGAPMIERGVQYLRDQWGISSKLAPIVAFILSISFNLGLGVLILHTDFTSSFLAGLATTLVACGWHEIAK